MRTPKRVIWLSCCSTVLQKAQNLLRLCSGTYFWRADFVLLTASLFSPVILHIKSAWVFISICMNGMSHSRAGHALTISTLTLFYFLNSGKEVLDSYQKVLAACDACIRLDLFPSQPVAKFPLCWERSMSKIPFWKYRRISITLAILLWDGSCHTVFLFFSFIATRLFISIILMRTL